MFLLTDSGLYAPTRFDHTPWRLLKVERRLSTWYCVQQISRVIFQLCCLNVADVNTPILLVRLLHFGTPMEVQEWLWSTRTMFVIIPNNGDCVGILIIIEFCWPKESREWVWCLSSNQITEKKLVIKTGISSTFIIITVMSPCFSG